MSSLRSSLLITFFSTNGATVVNFVVTLILARLLSPEDIGIFSISAVLVAIAQIFRDFGVGSYLQQEKELTPEKIQAASGVLMVSSWSLALLIYLLGEPAAAYYGQDGIRKVMHVLALGFIFIPFGSVTHALLTRDLMAKEQAMVNVFGTMAYASSSILLAYLDFGYMTSAWANLINIIVTGLAYAPFRPKNAPWLPSFTHWRGVTRFGLGAVLSNSVAALNNALADLLLGKLSGPRDVGLYSRANGTANIFMQVAGPTVNYAVLPHLSRTFHETGSVTKQLVTASAYLSVLAWPALALIAMFAHETIFVLYGEKWLECVPVVPITCLITALTLAVHFLGPTLTAVGRPYLAIFPNASLLVCRGLLVFVMFDGTLLSFAYGMLLGSIASIPIYIWLQTRFLAFPATQFLNAQVKSLYVTLLVLSLGLLIKETLPADTTPYRIFLLLGLLAPPTWWIGLRIFDHPFRYEVLSLIGNRRKGNRKGKPAPVGVLIPMKYPDSIGYVWRNVARQRDLVAQALLPRLQCYAAYPLLTGQASYKPEYMQAVELDCFNQNNLRNDKLLQFIRDNNIRVAFLMSEPANSQLTHYLQACGIATLTTENDSFDLDRRQSVVTAWSKWLLRSAFKKQIHCLHLANARKQYDFLHRFAKIPKLNLDIVHNGVNTEQFTPDAPPSTLFGLPDDPQKIWLISVAQARPIKRIPYLLEIFAELRQCRPGLNIGLIYVGSGDDLDNYKNLAAELGISKHVVFAGHQSDLTGLYTATDIYVHTAELESFGMAVAEAMASELAVVCTHAAGPAELIMDNVCGRLVPKEDREQLIQAILAYVDDPALRLAHGKAARQRIVTHYSQALQIRRLAANVKKVSQRVTRND